MHIHARSEISETVSKLSLRPRKPPFSGSDRGNTTQVFAACASTTLDYSGERAALQLSPEGLLEGDRGMVPGMECSAAAAERQRGMYHTHVVPKSIFNTI